MHLDSVMALVVKAHSLRPGALPFRDPFLRLFAKREQSNTAEGKSTLGVCGSPRGHGRPLRPLPTTFPRTYSDFGERDLLPLDLRANRVSERRRGTWGRSRLSKLATTTTAEGKGANTEASADASFPLPTGRERVSSVSAEGLRLRPEKRNKKFSRFVTGSR